MVPCRMPIVAPLLERVCLVGDGAGIAARDVHPAPVGFDDHREYADPEAGFGVVVFVAAD